MDAFNYLSVMVSIVLGLGLTQLFAGIGNLVGRVFGPDAEGQRKRQA